jgi:hypothetical protein
MLKKIIAAATLATMAASAYAAAPGSFYAGGDVGVTSMSSGSDTRGSIGGFGGYNFTEHFAVEAGYRRLTGFDDISGNYNADQLALSGVGTLRFTNGFNVFGRLGVNRVTVKADMGGYTYKDHQTKPLYGFGVGYDFGNNISARLEVQKPTPHSSNVSAGVMYSF